MACVRRTASTNWAANPQIELTTKPPQPIDKALAGLGLLAIGRKSWLFAGNDAFGQHHAVLWSLIASAEAHGIDPQAHLRSVLAKIGQTPLSELEQFLPEVWKREEQGGVLACCS